MEVSNDQLGLIWPNKSFTLLYQLFTPTSLLVCLHITNTEVTLIKRLFPIVLTFLLVAPLLLAQDSESNNPQPANIGGVWQISWQGRSDSEQATMQIQQDGSILSGTFQGFGGTSPLSGEIAGNNISFSVQLQGRPITLAFTGTVDGDAISGTFQPQGGNGGPGGPGGPGGGQGNRSWSGVRQQGNSGQSEPKESRDEDD
jgi:hypothetical protein